MANETVPVTEVDERYGADGAGPTEWAVAREGLVAAEIFWLTTVRADGRPHVTPLIAVWVDDALYICTGPREQKARNLAGNAHCALTTGCNRIKEGLDLVVEGEAKRVTDERTLARVARVFEDKYGSDWHFDVRDGAFYGTGTSEPAFVFRVAPTTAYGFGKDVFSHTRWRF